LTTCKKERSGMFGKDKKRAIQVVQILKQQGFDIEEEDGKLWIWYGSFLCGYITLEGRMVDFVYLLEEKQRQEVVELLQIFRILKNQKWQVSSAGLAEAWRGIIIEKRAKGR
jgi:hypothetical protein